MIFTTHWFLLFAFVVIGIYWILPRPQWRMGFLACACVLFHFYFAGPAGVIPIIVLMVITYFAGWSQNSAYCLAGIIICVGALCFYKYILFFVGSIVTPLNGALAETLSINTRAIMPGAPPLAVSFFTFEFVHYLIEVRRGGAPIRSPLKFVLFAIFFPSLVAGPIKRYTQFLPSLEAAVLRRASSDEIAHGLARVAVGFFKKIVLADQLTIYIDLARPGYEQLTLTGRWIFLGAIALRILFDFSGYSDIAIGCARLLGVKLPENFDWPYLARNIQDFWQRWHISLSSWIRDYVYIPLGGGRRGLGRRAVNGLIAFALCGLWHGPAWHFVAWGIYHGAGLAACATYTKIPVLGGVLVKIFSKEPVTAWLCTQVFVSVGWLLFFYPIEEALHLARLLGGGK